MFTLTLKLARMLWNVTATLVITLAILIALARLLLLNIHHQSEWFEQWLSRSLERPVSIGEINGHWQGWSPSVLVRDLTIIDSSDNPLVRFEHAEVDISFLESLRNRDLTPSSITLGGIKLTLERDRHGKFAIAGMPPSRWPVAQWIEGQRRFNLRDADITFIDHLKGGDEHHFNDLSLSIIRTGNDRRIVGRAVVSADQQQEWEFEVHADDSLLASQWSGNITLRTRDLNLDNLLINLGADLKTLRPSTVNLTLSSQWRHAKLYDATYRLQLTPQITERNLAVTDLAGTINRVADGWSIGVEGLSFNGEDFSEAARPVIRSRWQNDGADKAWSISNLPIRLLVQATQQLLLDEPDWLVKLTELKPDGIIRRASFLTLNAKPLVPVRGSVKIDSLSWHESGDVPGVSNTNFEATFDGQDGTARFYNSRNFQITSAKRLIDPLSASALDGNIRWIKSDNELIVSSPSLTLSVESSKLNISGDIKLRPDNGPEFDLLAQFETTALDQATKLLPKNLLPSKGEKWTRSALKSGKMSKGRALLRGNLADFPFDNNDGAFEVEIDVQDMNLQYGKKWPSAENLTGTLTIDKRKFQFLVESGHIYSSDLSDTKIDIADLFSKKRYVQISGSAKVLPAEVKRFIAESPLKNTKAKRFGENNISGDFNLELDINLGLFTGGEKEVLGQAHFNGNRVSSPALNLALDKLTGSVSFTRQDWYGENLTAEFENNRVGVLLNGGLDDPNYDTEIRLTGTSDAAYIVQRLEKIAPNFHQELAPTKSPPKISGSAPWKLVISLPSETNATTTIPRRVTLESSLEGLAIDLPWPLSKDAAQATPFNLTIISNAHTKRTTTVRIADRMKGQFVESAQSEGRRNLTGAELIFGESAKRFVVQDGISISGSLSYVDPSEWRRLLNKFIPGSQNLSNETALNVDVQISTLDLLGRRFNDVATKIHHENNGWVVVLDGEELSGRIVMPDNQNSQVIAEFDHLQIPASTENRADQVLDPTKIRPFSLVSAASEYGEINLGSMVIVTERIENGIRLTKAMTTQADFALTGSGKWTTGKSAHRSEFDVAVSGKSLAGLLGAFGYELANIEGGATEIEINAFWPGTPADFKLEKLRGHLSLRVDEGRFLDIEPGGGRLFGLLSLQTLPRRLSLDFNDLFTKGFTFDNIGGTFSIDKGNAYTNSLLLDGPSARIQISGRTGLRDQDYDQRVTVTPALSNSIPVASALFGPAGIGVGAVIYLGQKMFKSIPEQMDKFLSRDYSITGAWASPVIERI